MRTHKHSKPVGRPSQGITAGPRINLFLPESVLAVARDIAAREDRSTCSALRRLLDAGVRAYRGQEAV
jgi:hypothetical protein